MDCIVIDFKDNVENIMLLLADAAKSGKAVMIHNPSIGLVMHLAQSKQCQMTGEMNEVAKQLAEQLVELKEIDCEIRLEDEPNDIQPFTESHRNVSPSRRHVIWDYG